MEFASQGYGGLYSVLWSNKSYYSTGTVSTIGVNCTGSGTVITADMVGRQIRFANGAKRLIATRTDNTHFTIDRALVNDVTNSEYGIHHYNMINYTDGQLYFYHYNGSNIFNTSADGSFAIQSSLNVGRYYFSGADLYLGSDSFIKISSTTDKFAAKDLGLRRNSAGTWEINNGTAGQYRDLILRDLTTSGGKLTYGANDSAGTGYRTVRVPNA